jgi:2-dehydropantoate 2-reductase
VRRVLVIGAGAIGSLYAGHLAQVADVSVLVRRPEQARGLNDEGLRISGKAALTAALFAATDPDHVPECDLVILATKATQLEEAAVALGGRFPGATIMTIQNGLGAEEIVSRYGDWPLISAVTFMSGIRRSDTHVEYELDTETWLGPWAERGTPYESVAEVEAMLVRSGLRARSFPDLLPAQWSKLIFNASVNTVSALTELPHVASFAARVEPTDLGHLVSHLVEEGKRVAAARGVELHEDPWEMNVHAVSRGETAASDYAHLPSMLEDVLAKRRTEVDFITGALVREAAAAGVDVPLHLTMYRLVKGKEASW